MFVKKKSSHRHTVFFAVVIIMLSAAAGCGMMQTDRRMTEEYSTSSQQERQDGYDLSVEETRPESRGYDLPVEEAEREEAEADCEKVMERIFDLYDPAGRETDPALSDDVLSAMQEKAAQTGMPVRTSVPYSELAGGEKLDRFLQACADGKSGSIVLFEIHSDGGIGRVKYRYDGTDLYVLETNVRWNFGNGMETVSVFHNRIKEWRYSEKGWFCYELCVPEYPDVTEVVDGYRMIRVLPLTKEQQELSARCVQRPGYQGNNLLSSDWDAGHMENLDYNGLYEALYEMKYGERFDGENGTDGIPGGEFEELIMEYLPVTAEQLREYAAYDEEKQTYGWRRQGCGNYVPTAFGTSLPEVTGIRENEDGTVTLTVDAVCDTMMCDDALITHELTVRFREDGSFQYLGNRILGDGLSRMPEYRYRVGTGTAVSGQTTEV